MSSIFLLWICWTWLLKTGVLPLVHRTGLPERSSQAWSDSPRLGGQICQLGSGPLHGQQKLETDRICQKGWRLKAIDNPFFLLPKRCLKSLVVFFSSRCRNEVINFCCYNEPSCERGSFVMSLDRFVKRAASWEEHWESRFCTDAALFLIYLWRTPSQKKCCFWSICCMLDTPSTWPLYLEIVTCRFCSYLTSMGSSCWFQVKRELRCLVLQTRRYLCKVNLFWSHITISAWRTGKLTFQSDSPAAFSAPFDTRKPHDRNVQFNGRELRWGSCQSPGVGSQQKKETSMAPGCGRLRNGASKKTSAHPETHLPHSSLSWKMLGTPSRTFTPKSTSITLKACKFFSWVVDGLGQFVPNTFNTFKDWTYGRPPSWSMDRRCILQSLSRMQAIVFARHCCLFAVFFRCRL